MDNSFEISKSIEKSKINVDDSKKKELIELKRSLINLN